MTPIRDCNPPRKENILRLWKEWVKMLRTSRRCRVAFMFEGSSHTSELPSGFACTEIIDTRKAR
jgi:hypothetical protein